MGFDYHFYDDLNLIEVIPREVVHLSDVVSYTQEVLSLDILRQGTIEYVDLSKTKDSLDNGVSIHHRADSEDLIAD